MSWSLHLCIFTFINFCRPVSRGRPAFPQPSLGQTPWSTLRPSVFTGGLLVRQGHSTLTCSPPTARPSLHPVIAPPPLPPPLSPPSLIDPDLDQQGECKRYVSTVWIARWSLPWFPVAITSSVLIVPPRYVRVQTLCALCACPRLHRPFSSATCDLNEFPLMADEGSAFPALQIHYVRREITKPPQNQFLGASSPWVFVDKGEVE